MPIELYRKHPRDSETGFTLVELLVVIIIVGILAAVAIPAFLNQRQRANDASVKSDLKNIATQVETAFIQNPQAIHASSGPVSSSSSFQSGTLYVSVGNVEPTDPVDETNSTFSIKLSPGVIAKVRPGTGDGIDGYVILGMHENGKQYGPGRYLKYDSDKGGFQPETAVR